MTDTKAIFASKTVIGSTVAAVATLLQVTGAIEISSVEQQQIVDSLYVIAQLGGTMMAIYGRIVAKHTLTLPRE